MIRPALLALGFLAAATPAFAIDFDENAQGQIEFTMPSGNVGCIYTPEGGTDVYEPMGGGPELSCDRVEPAYVRVTMGPAGKPKRYNNVGDASCCGSRTTSSIMARCGDTMDSAACRRRPASICKRGGHGFSMSRKAIKTW